MADKRLYAKIDLGYFSNPKIFDLTSSQKCLHLASILYAREHLTDGIVKVRLLLALTDNTPQDAKALIDSGLWIDLGDGNAAVHDYAEHQETRGKVQQRSEKRRQAANARWGSKGRKEKDNTNANSNAPCNAISDANSNAPCNARENASNLESIKSGKIETGESEAGKSGKMKPQVKGLKNDSGNASCNASCNAEERRGEESNYLTPLLSPPKGGRSKTRRAAMRSLTDDWQPTEDHQRIATEKNIDLAAATVIFRDWALAGNKKYADWDACFRNALRGWLAEKLNPQAAPGGAYRPTQGQIIANELAQAQAWDAAGINPWDASKKPQQQLTIAADKPLVAL